jgi:hypothetical protein
VNRVREYAVVALVLLLWGMLTQQPIHYSSADRDPPREAVALRFVYAASPITAGAAPNCDGSRTVPQLNIGDFLCFMNRWSFLTTASTLGGPPAHLEWADCDGNGAVDPLDFPCFINAFSAGGGHAPIAVWAGTVVFETMLQAPMMVQPAHSNRIIPPVFDSMLPSTHTVWVYADGGPVRIGCWGPRLDIVECWEVVPVWPAIATTLYRDWRIER